MIVILSALHMQRSLAGDVGLSHLFCIRLLMYQFTNPYFEDHDFNSF